MKPQKFTSFLEEVHAEEYHGLDDDMPDAFDSWVSNLDGEEYIKFAEAYGKKQFIAGMQHSQFAVEPLEKESD